MSIFNELESMLKSEDSLEDLLRGEIGGDESEEGFEDDEDIEDEENEEEEDDSDLTDLMKYHKSLQKMILFIDELTDDGENNKLAFDVEVALRNAQDKLIKLNDEVYKDVKSSSEEETTEEETTEEV
jgi:hypothetical protein